MEPGFTPNVFDRVFEVVKGNTSIETQKELAVVLNVTQQSISDAKSRGRFPMEWLVKMSVVYGINLDTMLGLSTNGTSHPDQLISELLVSLKESLKKITSLDSRLEKIEKQFDTGELSIVRKT